jgi:hypothetical protein
MDYDLGFSQSSLLRALRDHDARMLRDIGLIRGEDGALRLAGDPARLALPPRRWALGGLWSRLFRRPPGRDSGARKTAIVGCG